MDVRRHGFVRYLDIAARIREDIVSGRYPAGSSLPSEQRLVTDYGCGRDTVRAALEVLRGEGLIIKRRGFPTIVTPLCDREPILVASGARITARIPMRPEAAQHGWLPNVPLLVVTSPSRDEALYPADRAALIVP